MVRNKNSLKLSTVHHLEFFTRKALTLQTLLRTMEMSEISQQLYFFLSFLPIIIFEAVPDKKFHQI